MTRLPFEIFLSLRYLKPKRTFMSVISLISVTGVTIGVWVLITVIAVMTGFDRELREKLVGIQAHVTVNAGGGLISRRDTEMVLEKAEKLPHVKAAAPYVLGLVLVEFNKKVATPYVKGIDPGRELKVSRLGEFVKVGALDVDGEKAVIGRELAHQLGVFLGDKITVFSPRNIEKKGEEAYLPVELEVTGIFESGMFEYDVGLMFTSLETAQDLYEMGNAAHGIELATDDPMVAATGVAEQLNRELPAPLRAQTWAELNRRLLGAVQVEKTMEFIIVGIICVVAAFSVMNTLITVTVLKTGEIGVLKSLGATAGRVMRIFLFQGFVIGVFGVLAGTACGLLTIHYLNDIVDALRRMGVETFDPSIYGFTHLPAYLAAKDLVIISGSALLMCTVAGVIPAWWAARLEPVEALHYE